MIFSIDVSGEDIFNQDYSICLSNNEIIKGFKFNEELIQAIRNNYSSGKYKYAKSKKNMGLFKVRLYCIAIHYLFQSIKKPDYVHLTICKDFSGHDHDIDSNLRYFLENLQKIRIDSINHERLNKGSTAHEYAYLMRRDTKNKMKTYVNISLEQFEKFLKIK